MIKKAIVVAAFLMLFSGISYAQTNTAEEIARDEKTQAVVEATDFSIPSSPAFTLLGVNPSKVTKPGFSKDIKLDVIFKDKELVSDISFEIQPVWLFYYYNKSLKDYQAQNPIVRALSTLNLSLATIETNNIKSLAYSIKLNIYRSNNPMLDSTYLANIRKNLSFSDVETHILLQLEAKIEDVDSIEAKLAKANIPFDEQQQLNVRLRNLGKQIEELVKSLDKIDARDKARLKAVREDYMNRTWNSSMVDLGFGQICNYDNSALDSIKFDSKGLGGWFNGSLGIGKRLLLSGLVKFVKWEHTNTQFYGANFRYGNSKSNFFVEFVYEQHDKLKRNIISYGGEYRIDQKKALEFSLATEYNDDFKLKNLMPQVRLNWNLAMDMLK